MTKTVEQPTFTRVLPIYLIETDLINTKASMTKTATI